MFSVAALCLMGGLYWQLVCQIAGVAEPWDAAGYWTLWYPVSLLLSGIAGWLRKSHGWYAGALLTFAQLPIRWINNDTDVLWPVALLFLGLLAVPATVISVLAGWFADRA